MQDQFGRKLEYLRLSVTDRCNLRCHYCMPEGGIFKHEHHHMLRHEDYVSIVEAMAALGVKKVRLTGGEPLVRKGLNTLISEIHNVKGIEEVTLTTNGLLLEEQAETLMRAGVSRLNVSIDSLNPQTYYNITRGGDLKAVLRGIEKAHDIGMRPIKINVVLIKGENEHEVDAFLNALNPCFEVRFIELMPIGEAASWSKDKFIDLQAFFQARTDLVPAYKHGDGGPCRYYQHVQTGRYVGIINALSEHFCDTCNRLRVTSEGLLKTCLHDAREVDLRPFLKDQDALKHVITNAVLSKPKEHQLNHKDGQPIARDMYTIGG